jgi:D-psicose/D-tagatose/L-ribulose 3-epimerase
VPRRIGVCAWIYGDAALEETLARIAGAGYDGVEIPGEPQHWIAEDLRRLLAAAGLAPVGLTASCTVPATRRDLAHPNPAVRRDALGYLVDCLHLAGEIGAPLVQMLPSGETRLAPLATREEEWGWSVAAMQEAGREAARCGIRICVEPLNRYEAYLVTDAAEALAYVRAVGSPWVGMTLDCFHANLEEADIAGAIRAAGSRLWHLHVADTNRRGLGHGHLDLVPIGGALDAIGYPGAVVLEVMPPGPDPFQSIKDQHSPGILDGYLRDSLAPLRAHLGTSHA